MVHRGPGATADGDVAGGGRVVGRLEERRVDDPKEAPLVLVDQAAAPADLETLLALPSSFVFVLMLQGKSVGMCEFNGVGNADVELMHFGLVPEAQGRRLGPFLLDWSLRRIWAEGAKRIWLHTDTNDHAKAQSVYARAGFAVFDRRLETFPD